MPINEPASSPADRHLDKRRVEVQRAIMDGIDGLGYEAQAFGTTFGSNGSRIIRILRKILVHRTFRYRRTNSERLQLRRNAY